MDLNVIVSEIAGRSNIADSGRHFQKRLDFYANRLHNRSMRISNSFAGTAARTKSMRRIEAATGRDLAELLTDLYYRQSLTLGEIALQIGVPIGTLGGWFVRLGISRSELARNSIARSGAR